MNRIAFFCFGNRDRADDCFGLIVADKLTKIYPKNVFSEELDDISTFLVDIIDTDKYDCVVIIDAINYGAQPGSLIVTSEISNHIRSISSHSIPLEQIKEIIDIKKKEFLFIGAQVKSIDFLKEPSSEILKAIEKTINFLR